MRSAFPEQRSTSRTDRIRIIVADDHVTVLEGLVAIIGRQPDMQVLAAANNGREAVDLWVQHRPDVTLLDLRMPVLDGVGATREIRALPGSRATIPILAASTVFTSKQSPDNRSSLALIGSCDAAIGASP